MTQIQATVRPVAQLFLQGNFRVPWHQRYYDWTEELVDELLMDLSEAIHEDRKSYFLGSIMLIERVTTEWDINDGQQRLITLSLIFASLARRFRSWRRPDTVRASQCSRYLFNVPEHELIDPADTSRKTPRVKPPQTDHTQFMQIVRGHEIGTNGKLTTAWNHIDRFVSAMSRRDTVQFFEFLTQRTEIAVLNVPPTEDANAVFEALNGRGKQLDDVDLIRNHLYSYFSSSKDQIRRGTIHEALERTAIKGRNGARTQDYYRCFLQCRYGYLQNTRFYRETRAKIRAEAVETGGRDSVYSLVTALGDPVNIELFRTMTATNPNADLVSRLQQAAGSSRAKRSLRDFLAELLTYSVTRPLLFAILRRFIYGNGAQKNDVARCAYGAIRDLTSFVMRVALSTPKFEPSRYEAAFANQARTIGAATEIDSIGIMSLLRECDEYGIMDDDRFVTRMIDNPMTDSRRAKRYLFAINSHEQKDSSVLDLRGCTLEHILPKSKEHWPGWSGFHAAGFDLKSWTLLPGNLALMGKGDNRGSRKFNSNFTAKRKAFEQSSFVTTRRLAKYHDWTPQRIRDRSKHLARKAARIWCFSDVANVAGGTA